MAKSQSTQGSHADRDGSFTYKNCGTNTRGNHYCTRDYGPGVANRNAYHYSNTDGSYYYSNPNGSTYHNNGQGRSTYTTPTGFTIKKQGE